MKRNNRTISWAFALVMLGIALFTIIGMVLTNRQPIVLQGQVEATEIRIGPRPAVLRIPAVADEAV